MIAVDAAGKLQDCGQPAPTSKYKLKYPELIPIACQQLMAQFTAIPAKDVTDKPVRSVQTASVSFSTSD
jgi:hypothetical protein